MTRHPPYGITLGQFATAFVPSAVLLSWALLQPELSGDGALGRTKLTIWAATLLLLPALVLQLFRGVGWAVANLADLFWTAALLVYLVHVYWAVFLIFDGVADTFRQQGPVIAGGAFLLLGLWMLDVVLIWLRLAHRYVRYLQIGVRGLAFAIFALTLVVLRGEGAVQVLGFVFTGTLAAAGLLRLAAGRVPHHQPRVTE